MRYIACICESPRAYTQIERKKGGIIVHQIVQISQISGRYYHLSKELLGKVVLWHTVTRGEEIIWFYCTSCRCAEGTDLTKENLNAVFVNKIYYEHICDHSNNKII